MSNSANYRQNAQQSQSLNVLSTIMSTHTQSQVNTNASVDALKLATETRLDAVNTKLDTLNTNTPYPHNPNTPATYTNSYLLSVKNNTADVSTSTLQATANGHLSTIATNSATNAEFKGYSDIADDTTATNIKASTEGRLEVQIVGSDDTTGATPHRHLTIDGNGRTHTLARIEQSPTINAKLDVVGDNTAQIRTTTHVVNVPAIAFNNGGTTYDLGTDYYKMSRLSLSMDSVNSAPMNLYLQSSTDSTNWKWATGISFIGLNGGGTLGMIANVELDRPFRYWRLYNNDSAMDTFIISNLYYTVDKL